MSDSRKILVIDDQIGLPGSPGHRTFLYNYGKLDYNFVLATAEDAPGRYSIAAALAKIEYHSDAALVILDIKFGQESDRLGVDILVAATSRYPSLPVVMMTSLEDERSTVDTCIRFGAKDYITKGVPPDEFAHVIKRYVRRVTESHLLLGRSEKIVELRRTVERIAQDAMISVLISGERGTGKELVARSIHCLGRRRSGPFVSVNCAAFPTDQLAAELFGVEKGAFPGARQTKYGHLELATRGVLFLDEIPEASLEVQAILLRALETGRFCRVGGSQRELAVDFQLLCATSRLDLADWTSRNLFRADLYDRIGGTQTTTPPLRDCPEDIELLADHFLRNVRESQRGIASYVGGFSPEALACLRSYSWPGNVRELKSVVERAMVLANGGQIARKDLPRELRGLLADESGNANSENSP